MIFEPLRFTGGLLACLLFFSQCSAGREEQNSKARQVREQLSRQFSIQMPPVPVPENNRPTPEKVELGEALFFDPNLSSCGTIACASCHLPENGFGDGHRVSTGCNGAQGKRNSSSLYQAAYLSHLFWDGRAQSLEEQALGPIVDPLEMANNWEELLHYLATGEHRSSRQVFAESRQFYAAAFGRVFGGEISSTTVAKALAAYERTLVSRNAPFDRWMEGDDGALSRAQLEGAVVFFGRGRCSECHPPPHFTDSDFHNVGTQEQGRKRTGLFPSNESLCGGIENFIDPGRAGIPALQTSCQDLGKFRTPSLRNVELSAPYMHNGDVSSLDGVLQHYWNVGRGTTTAMVGELDERVTGVMLTDFGGHPEDIINLIEFLRSLTGTQVKGPQRGISPPGMKPIPPSVP